MKSGSRALLACTLCFLLLFNLALSAQSTQFTVPAELSEFRPAAVPPFFTYGGTLLDSLGKPLSGVVGLTFSLYAEQQGGTPLWIDTQNLELDSGGRYVVVLGAAGRSLPLDLFSAGQPRWLGVQTQNAGDAEQPRVLLVSVPYALKAGDADTIGGKPASAFVLADDNSQTSSKASTSGDDPVVSAVSGTGSQDFLAKWTDNAGTLGSSIVKETLGNVGIGAASPLEKLEVNGNLRLAGQNLHVVQIQGAASSGRLGQDGNGFFFASDTAGKALSFHTNDGFGLNERMRISDNGFVGLGTTSPSERLHVNGNLQVSGTLKVGGNILGTLDFQNTVDGNNGVLKFGGYRFVHNFGAFSNTFLGANAGNFTMTGFGQNTGIGNVALASNTSGNSNTGIGYGALFFNTTGSSNTASGSAALLYNTIGFDNTATGSIALASNTIGNGNTADGAGALYSNATGIGNTANGAYALYQTTSSLRNTASGFYSLTSNTTGSENTASGGFALTSNITGFHNVASGAYALRQNTTGTRNTADGTQALYDNTVGVNNTAVGWSAGSPTPANGNTTGSNNTFLGFMAGPGSPTQLTNATAIGAQAVVSASDALVLGNSAVSVGIGTSSPTSKLDVNGTVKATAFVGDGSGLTNLAGGGAATDVNCANACISTGEIADGAVTSVKIADGTIADADVDAAAGIAPTKILGTAAILAANTFSGSQTISIGNLVLPVTSSTTTGIITKGTTSLLHTFGTDSTFLGISAGNFTFTGSRNTAFGVNAMTSDTTGQDNTAIGAHALRSNTTGLFNTGSGSAALFSNTSGQLNTATGSSSLFNNTSGSGNTGDGMGALSFNTTGNFNTATGATVLQHNTSGSNNTAVGYAAGDTANFANANTTGSNNTFLGFMSGPGTASQLNNAAAIGANALVSADNTLVLGDANVSVAIGASTAATKLQVVGDIRVGTSGTNGCIQGFGGAPIAGTCSSDLRLKKNIESFSSVLDEVVQLQPVSYDWQADEHPEYHFGNARTSGLIAQEVEKVFPDMVVADERGFKAVNYSQLPLLLLQAMKELKAQSDNRERLWAETVREQQAQIQELLMVVKALKRK